MVAVRRVERAIASARNERRGRRFLRGCTQRRSGKAVLCRKVLFNNVALLHGLCVFERPLARDFLAPRRTQRFAMFGIVIPERL